MPRKRLFSLLALLALLISLTIAIPLAHGDGEGAENFALPEKQELQYPNLGSHLDQLVALVEEGILSAEQAAAGSPIHTAESVAVAVHLSGNADEVVDFLIANGGDPRNVGEDYIEAYVPVPLLGQLSEQPGVVRVREIVPPQPAYGDVTSQGVQAHGAWHDAGHTGRGVKVGIIDTGFEGFSGLIGQELPAPVGVRCYTGVGVFTNNLADCEIDDVHGTAVAETVIDIAPEVSLYIAYPNSKGDLRETVDWMVSEGVSVINYSVDWGFDGPGDGTSPSSDSPLNTVDRAVDGGIIWVNAAGSAAQQTWFQSGNSLVLDSNGFVEFAPSEILNCFPLTSEMPIAVTELRWDDTWGGATRDMDLYLVDPSTGAIIAASEDPQSGESGHYPYEYLTYEYAGGTETRGCLAVSQYAGSRPDWIQVRNFADTPDLLYYTGNGSIGNPAESANPGMMAVGATHYWDTHTIASYSSQGPTPDGRVKPDIVGTACGEVASYGYDYRDENLCWFPGTSQASPHVAGLAALVRQQFPAFTPEQVADYLKNAAEQRESPDPNNTWGHGFAVLPPGAAYCEETVTVDGAVSGQWAAGCDSAVDGQAHARYYSFDLPRRSEVTITLESGDADTYLYLRDGSSGELLGENDDHQGDTSRSQITATLAAGTYTVEATTYNPGATGGFTLTLSGLGGSPRPGGECGETITADGAVAGQWAAGCDSAVSERGHARYYTFTLARQSDVTITLESSDADTHLYLRDGEARMGAARHENADHQGSTGQSRITETLPAGTYTVEATTYSPGETGGFTLTVGGLDSGTAPPRPADDCGETITADGAAVAGQWAAGCDSAVSERGHARYYTFTLAQELDFTITLESNDADTYLYFRDGEARRGAARNRNDDHQGDLGQSRITETLLPGTYTVEATTHSPGETGGFTLTVGGPGVDRAALVALYHATDGPNWTNNTNWLSDAPIGEWHGVATDASGRVAILVLTQNQLSGEIPPELGTLARLTLLFLFDNQLNGAIPPKLGNLVNLEVLWLSGNQLSGAIPPQLGNLASLTWLFLSGNQLTGYVPAGWRDVPNNDFDQLGLPFYTPPVSSRSGTSPTGSTRPTGPGTDRAALVALYDATGGPNWANNTNWLTAAPIGEWYSVTTDANGRVTELDLFSNQLSGAIPPELGNLASLTGLSLWGNQLSGAIPPELGDLTNLTNIYLSRNQLTGCVPAGLQDVPRNDFDQLGLPFCGGTSPTGPDPDRAALVALYDATGGPNWTNKTNWRTGAPIGEWHGVTTDDSGRVTILDLGNNQLSGAIPTQLGNLSSLEWLYLYDNQLSGAIPTQLGNLASLTVLSLFDNQLSGEIPPELGNLASLTRLRLNVNQLSGAIPPELGNLASLTSLGLQENQLSGAIPTQLGNLASLTVLFLDDNQLSGAIPPELGDLTNLTDIHLSGNQLTGCVPAGLLDVTNNDLAQLGLPSCGTVASDRAALVALYHATDGPNWTNSTNWLTDAPIGEWGGVTTDANGRVVRLDLFNNQLSGAIPPELGNLASLEWLYLYENQLSGAIPPELGNLASLELLLLRDNQLSGAIPPELGNLASLTHLYLYGNQLSGAIPPELGNLTSLTYLELYRNQLSGAIPPELGNLASLTVLRLDGNQLSEAIPLELGNLASLTYLLLRDNQLSGAIPTELGDLNNLTHIYLSGNQLTGCVPAGLQDVPNHDLAQLGLPFCGTVAADRAVLVALYAATTVGQNWTTSTNWNTDVPIGEWHGVTTDANGRVATLILFNNQLRGAIPPDLGNLDSLTLLVLAENQLSGPIPPDLGNLDSLTSLVLYANQLSGAIPPELGNLDSLTLMYLHANQLSGAIPPELGNLDSLTSLVLYGNQLSGAIPPDLGNLDSLTELYLYGNELSGAIPPDLGNLDSLTGLYLNNNQLSGAIPPDLGNLDSLTWLYLYGNQLSGAIPPDLGNLVNLEVLWLDNNQLSGAIPPDLGNLASLTSLHLNNNQLSGAIPLELGNLANLEILYLHENQLSGAIPRELGNLASLTWLYLYGNQLSGAIPRELGNLASLTSLYLYDNQLSEEIPQELGNLASLTVLSLGENQLSGAIPPELGNLASLTVLALGENQLSGAIPPELGNLDSLTGLWLYENQLSGAIPPQLGNLDSLELLYLRGNQLSEEIPPELGNLASLTVLSLSANQLSGAIPPQLGNLASLTDLYLHENQLSGAIPPQLGNLASLTGLWLHENQLSGAIPPELGNLASLTELRLSANQLNGEIPPDLGNLASLTWLLLSGNQLTGCVPAGLQDVPNNDFAELGLPFCVP